MVRELAFNKDQPNLLASGGYDQFLCLSDLNSHPHRKAFVDLGAVIGSVKWPKFNNNYCVSCTTDNGVVRMFDVRMSLAQKPPFMLDTKKEELFAHERYADFNMLLGFGNGDIMHVDMRTGQMCLRRFVVISPLVAVVYKRPAIRMLMLLAALFATATRVPLSCLATQISPCGIEMILLVKLVSGVTVPLTLLSRFTINRTTRQTPSSPTMTW
jgi:WD40 repeat protein